MTNLDFIKGGAFQVFINLFQLNSLREYSHLCSSIGISLFGGRKENATN